MEDERIIALLFQRSEEALRCLVDKYGRVCHSMSYRILGDRRDAEECVNDAYLGGLEQRAAPAARSPGGLSVQDRPQSLHQAVPCQPSGQAAQRLRSGPGGVGC